MTDSPQIPLAGLEPEPQLTHQQRAVYEALKRAGKDGLYAEEAGALAHELMASKWSHSRDERCKFCGQRGQQILKRLRTLGLARYRRNLKAWQAVGFEAAGGKTLEDNWDSLIEAGF